MTNLDIETFWAVVQHGTMTAAAEALFERRMRQCRGQLIPCDSFALSHQLEVRLGARRLMPEIGAQTPDTRVQIAYARGSGAAWSGSCRRIKALSAQNMHASYLS